MKKIFTATIFISFALIINAQTAVDTTAINNKVYQLGEVTIIKTIDEESVRSDNMQKNNTNNVASSLKNLPSIILNNSGARNESSVYVRGFDIRSVPVFLDGIPVYIPYDGYVDLARFTTYDISKIDVSKGFSSMMYGANTLGGAINLISLKPTHKLEINSRAGMMSGDGYDAKLNIGNNLGKVYFQANFSYLKRDFIPLSANFDTTTLETNYKRDNSFHKDLKTSIKIGFTPNETDEYSINYIYSHGSKGNPVYLGSDENTRVRFWQWPYWDKQSIYFISAKAIGSKTYLKVRFYYDKFKNKLSSFDDNTYTSQDRRYAFNSFYDDYTLGGNAELTRELGSYNTLKISAHLKNDNHSEHNEGDDATHISDNTISFGLEDIFKPTERLTFIPGVSFNIRQSLKAEFYNPVDNVISEHPVNTNNALNAQLATYYRFSESILANFNIAYKNRFATMKDRYSYRIGRALPNPELKSERALNLELATTFSVGQKLSIRPELFYSRLSNTIQLVSYVQDDLSQMQNTGSSEFAGADLSIIYQPLENLRFYSVYSYIKRTNLSNPEILFIDVPKNKLFASAEYDIAKKLFLYLSGEVLSERINSSDGLRVSSGYAIANAQVSYRFAKYLSVEAGVNNLFDKNYTIEEGYPEAGQNFYMALNFNINR